MSAAFLAALRLSPEPLDAGLQLCENAYIEIPKDP